MINLPNGTYVVAVSGGVDSMALLHILNDLRTKNPKGYKFVIAHFDHGIRDDSHIDRQLVQQTTKTFGLPFVFNRAELGQGASEESARKARYEFLRKVMDTSRADAIITAHHHDDVIETAIHNILRGTGRRGLSSLKNTKYIKRPLLNLAKDTLIDYAKKNNVPWREDSTNKEVAYTRNYIRRNVIPKLTLAQKAELLNLLNIAREINKQIDLEIKSLLKSDQVTTLDRKWFRNLPHSVSKEVMASWLRKNNATFDKRLIDYLVIASKTFRIGKNAHVDGEHYLHIAPKDLELKLFEATNT